MKNLYKFLVFIGATLLSAAAGHAAPKQTDKTAYDFAFESLVGDPMPMIDYKGKLLLVVNTASRCGFTKQYKGLQALYDKYKDRGLVVIGVPSNDFGSQEPNSEEEIKKFCELNFGVTFPMTSKYQVTGPDAHPFYKWVGEVTGSTPKWNFHKYLIGRDGKPVDYFGSATEPDAKKLNQAIEKLL